MALKLVIGNKNYSSWSMRPWLALRANHIAFEEIFIPLYTGAPDKQRILGFTQSGKVPALLDGDVTIWDSLAIIEYAAERFPQMRLWPEDRASRAYARSISAEMHSGFAALRNECGMNLHRPVGAIMLSANARAESRAFSRSGSNAASATENPDRSCSVPLAARTPCSRRWCIVFAPMPSRWRRWCAITWIR
jgi:glutathione S-transferase